jgi:hypothetical protein
VLNIVDPTSTISRETAPFTLVGNRGELHEDNRIVRHANGNDWLYCVTSALADPKDFMAPGKFTDLFFLDEATALAAGHRPCGLCNRARFVEFVNIWKKVYGVSEVSAHQIDAELEANRVQGTKQVTYRRDAAELPSGVIVREFGRPQPLLLFRYEQPQQSEHWCVYPWSSHGYGVKEPRPNGHVEVLTPQPIVEVIRMGFTPDPVHPLLAW